MLYYSISGYNQQILSLIQYLIKYTYNELIYIIIN